MSGSMEIPDAAVEAAHAKYYEGAYQFLQSASRTAMRAALVAARPYLMPEVVVDHRPGETCSVAAEVDPGTGFARPLLDRDKVSQVLVSFALGGREGAASPHELLGMAVHAIEGLARPMPTRFEIAASLHGEKHGDGCTFANPSNCDRWHEAVREADAVVALLNGEIKKGEDR